MNPITIEIKNKLIAATKAMNENLDNAKIVFIYKVIMKTFIFLEWMKMKIDILELERMNGIKIEKWVPILLKIS